MEEARKVRPSMEEKGSGSPSTLSPGTARSPATGRSPNGLRGSADGRSAHVNGPFAERRMSAEMPMKGSGLSDNMSLADTQRGSLRFLGTEVDQACPRCLPKTLILSLIFSAE